MPAKKTPADRMEAVIEAYDGRPVSPPTRQLIDHYLTAVELLALVDRTLQHGNLVDPQIQEVLARIDEWKTTMTGANIGGGR